MRVTVGSGLRMAWRIASRITVATASLGFAYGLIHGCCDVSRGIGFLQSAQSGWDNAKNLANSVFVRSSIELGADAPVRALAQGLSWYFGFCGGIGAGVGSGTGNLVWGEISSLIGHVFSDVLPHPSVPKPTSTSSLFVPTLKL